jgi:tetratricopeptide (TPR) repeat protein
MPSTRLTPCAKSHLRALIALLLLCVMALPLSAGKAYTYQENLLRMLDSRLSYVMHFEEDPAFKPPTPKTATYTPDFYQARVDGDLVPLKYELDKKAAQQLDRAEEFFGEGMYDMAADFYREVLKKHPENSTVLTYLGQALRNLDDIAGAKTCYQQAIEINFHNYMPHWFLANIHLLEGDLEHAVEEIAIAKVLNRNNPRLQEHFANIMQRTGRDGRDCYYDPQVIITRVDADTIKVRATMEWMPCGMVEALWEYEPDFHEEERANVDYFNFTRAAEVYGALASSYIKLDDKYKQDPMLGYLLRSVKDHSPAFVAYEMLLPDTPMAVFGLSKEDILGMRDYLLEIKTRK